MALEIISGILACYAIAAFFRKRIALRNLRAEKQKLEILNARHLDILKSLREGFITLGFDGKISYINPEGCRYLGTTETECIGKDFFEAFPKLRESSVADSIRRVSQDKVASETLDSIHSSWFEIRAYPVFDGISVFFRDVTERKTLENVLQEQRAKAAMASKMSTLGEMASGVAHEINNPLMIILTRCEQLQDMAESGQANLDLVKQCSEKIHTTVMRISRIVKALRTFGRDGETDPFEPTTLNSIVNETLELCRQKFAFHRVNLQVTGLDEPVMIHCRPTQISQVLLNLLGNSFDAVYEGNRARWVHVHVTQDDDYVNIRVTDSGTGLKPQVLQKLFQPFYTTKEVGKGTGLGLSISRNIAQSHSGSLEYDEANANTSFVLKLPRKLASPSSKAA